VRCRPGCGACCVAISISSPLPGLPGGKPAGQRCPHLSQKGLCGLFGHPDRPEVCSAFQAVAWLCGASQEEAFRLISEIERLTTPTTGGARRFR
jgi:Fe-S-cluster containining protein